MQPLIVFDFIGCRKVYTASAYFSITPFHYGLARDPFGEKVSIRLASRVTSGMPVPLVAATRIGMDCGHVKHGLLRKLLSILAQRIDHPQLLIEHLAVLQVFGQQCATTRLQGSRSNLAIPEREAIAIAQVQCCSQHVGVRGLQAGAGEYCTQVGLNPGIVRRVAQITL